MPERYAALEEFRIHGGPRMVHDEFCMVSDFPELIKGIPKTARIPGKGRRSAGGMAGSFNIGMALSWCYIKGLFLLIVGVNYDYWDPGF